MSDSSKLVFDFLNYNNIKKINGVLLSNDVYDDNYNLKSIDIIVINNNGEVKQDIDTIDGVKINYLICSLSELRKILLDEIYNNKSFYLQKVVDSNVLFDKDGSNKIFVTYFRNLYSIVGKCDIKVLKLLNKFINDLGKIIDTVYFDYMYLNVVEKIKTLYINLKDYKNSYDLVFDYDFLEFYNNCLTANIQSEKYDNLRKLYYYCFGNIDLEMLSSSLDITEIKPKIKVNV